ncbi:MAG: hypothetical protein ACI9LS_000850, partial [Flavobacteriales bacterium]
PQTPVLSGISRFSCEIVHSSNIHRDVRKPTF